MKKIWFILIVFFAACSTQKNTTVTRTYHNLTAHYNVYFNAYQSFLAGVNKVEKEHKDDYSRILPIFKYDYDDVPSLVASDMETTIQKAGKTIIKHSITVKPKFKRKNLTPKDLEFMKKKEFCKWIDDAYLLVGKANFYKKKYQNALITFRNILSKYKDENTRYEAQLWLAKTYIAQKKFQDAYNTLDDLVKHPDIPKKLKKEIQLTWADYYLKQKDYNNAIDKLLVAIDLIKKRRKKARLYFILAQLYQVTGNNQNAAFYYKKVLRSNPDYDLAFNAKIARATAFTESQNASEIIKQLNKLLKDEKNEDYQDKIYYALAMVYLKQKDTAQAITLLKKSAAKSVSDESAKALAFLALADIYFTKKQFLLAGKYYDSTMQYLNKNYPDYNKISKRAENTGLLVKYLGEVKLQDSLQKVAKMPENERNKLIQNLIQQAIAEKERQRQAMNDNTFFDPLDNMNPQNNVTTQGGKWYMYNPVLVSRGQAEFRKRWGNRKLEDNWRRKNKTVINDNDEDAEENKKEEDKITDNTKPEFYLQNLPLTDSLMEISNNKIKEALFNAALVYEERFSDYKKAAKLYEELNSRFPGNKYQLETYYRLYNIARKNNELEKAAEYRKKIILEYPNSLYAKILQDPSYINKIEKLNQRLENIYENVLQNYFDKKYQSVITAADSILKKYPETTVAPNFCYLKAVAYGNLGYIDSMKNLLEKTVKNYPNSEIVALARSTLKVIESGKYDYSVFSYKPDDEHAFMCIFDKKTNATILKFQIYSNAQSFSEKEYEVVSENFDDNNNIIVVKWFDNLEQAKSFYNLIKNSDVFDLANSQSHSEYLISKKNYEILRKDNNLTRYQIFYEKNYNFN